MCACLYACVQSFYDRSSCCSTGSEWKLLLIGSIRSVGVLPLCGQVYCIQRLIVIPLTTESSPEIVGLEVHT